MQAGEGDKHVGAQWFTGWMQFRTPADGVTQDRCLLQMSCSCNLGDRVAPRGSGNVLPNIQRHEGVQTARLIESEHLLFLPLLLLNTCCPHFQLHSNTNCTASRMLTSLKVSIILETLSGRKWVSPTNSLKSAKAAAVWRTVYSNLQNFFFHNAVSPLWTW